MRGVLMGRLIEETGKRERRRGGGEGSSQAILPPITVYRNQVAEYSFHCNRSIVF